MISSTTYNYYCIYEIFASELKFLDSPLVMATFTVVWCQPLLMIATGFTANLRQDSATVTPHNKVILRYRSAIELFDLKSRKVYVVLLEIFKQNMSK